MLSPLLATFLAIVWVGISKISLYYDEVSLRTEKVYPILNKYTTACSAHTHPILVLLMDYLTRYFT